MFWFDEIEFDGESYPVQVESEWEAAEATRYEGYWDIMVFDRHTDEDLTRLLSRDEQRRLAKKAMHLARESYNGAAPDPYFD